MRKEHILKSLRNIETPTEFIFFDTESTTEKVESNKVKHTLSFGVAKYIRFDRIGDIIGEKELMFTTPEEFWKFVNVKISTRHTLYLVAHNIKYDATMVQAWQNLPRLGFEVSYVFAEGHTFISQWKREKDVIYLLDNSNWFKGKLKSWGKVLGLPKLTMPEGSNDIKAWVEYCTRDVQILVELQRWLITWLRENNVGSWKYTIPSISFASFRYRFMKHTIVIPSDKDEETLARQAYRGGRTEVFRAGKYTDDTYYKIDVNSMYPYVMRNNEYPTQLRGIAEDAPIDSIKRAIDKYAIIANVDLNTQEPYFPIYNGYKNVYPIGRFNTTLTTPELRLALDKGYLIKVHKLAIYDKRPIFTQFVDCYYSQRLHWKEEKDDLRDVFCKLILNSLYGKMGQTGRKDIIIGYDPNMPDTTGMGYDAETGKKYSYLSIGGTTIRQEKEGESYNSFCAIAAHVTAYARIYLYDLILLAGRENVFYTDTDSMIVNQDGYNRLEHLLHPTELGKLKLEGIEKLVNTYAPKHYEFGEKLVIKGVPTKATKIEDNKYTFETWPGFKTSLTMTDGHYYNPIVEKKLTPKIDTGRVNPQGFVIPFVFPDDYDYSNKLSKPSSNDVAEPITKDEKRVEPGISKIRKTYKKKHGKWVLIIGGVAHIFKGKVKYGLNLLCTGKTLDPQKGSKYVTVEWEED